MNFDFENFLKSNTKIARKILNIIILKLPVMNIGDLTCLKKIKTKIKFNNNENDKRRKPLKDLIKSLNFFF